MNFWVNKGIREVIVYRSISNDVYQNLALEDWIYHNVDLQFRRILLLWRNKPCVVIGRHQNPWMESNLKKLEEQKVKIARRRSGGGAVYHDLGNLNCTFFSNRDDYDRLRNLQLACDAVNGSWNLGLRATQRGDIMTKGGKKVSGSAAKLSKNKSYHHFTVLIDVNKESLRNLLRHDSNLCFSSSSSTPSVPSPTANLTELASSNVIVTYDELCKSLATLFYQRHHLNHDEIYDIDPELESTFPNITLLKDNLVSDSWIYNKTPTFTVTDKKINASFTVSKGMITDTTNSKLSHLIGRPYIDFNAYLRTANFHRNF